MEQTAQVPSGQRGREESAGDLQRFGNSVPPGESNDELLDRAWEDHTGESLDAKKVKEARQLEMEYYDKMHVFRILQELGIAGSVDSNRHELSNKTYHYERWTCME